MPAFILLQKWLNTDMIKLTNMFGLLIVFILMINEKEVI